MNVEGRKPRALRNVTITLEPVLLKRARIRAANADLSVSQYIARLLTEDFTKSHKYRRAMHSYLSRKPLIASSGEPYPKRDELYGRARFR
jgi:hypothetical protein